MVEAPVPMEIVIPLGIMSGVNAWGLP